MQDRDSLKKQKLVDLIRENHPPLSTAATQGSHWLQGNHNIVINGGNVSIHLPASACPAKKDGCDE